MTLVSGFSDKIFLEDALIKLQSVAKGRAENCKHGRQTER